jgi:hypothetical protein
MREVMRDRLGRLGRLREVLAGALLAVAGLWGAVATFGATRWLAAALALLGLVLVWTGVQRLRLGARAGRGGAPGAVTVDERRVVYWGPFAGGGLDLDDLAALDLDRSGQPEHWILSDRRGRRLAVPLDAEGAGALLDALGALPGLGPGRLIAALDGGAGGVERVWTCPPERLPPD